MSFRTWLRQFFPTTADHIEIAEGACLATRLRIAMGQTSRGSKLLEIRMTAAQHAQLAKECGLVPVRSRWRLFPSVFDGVKIVIVREPKGEPNAKDS